MLTFLHNGNFVILFLQRYEKLVSMLKTQKHLKKKKKIKTKNTKFRPQKNWYELFAGQII